MTDTNPNPSILVVDDEQGVEMIFSKIVSDQGYSLRYCSSAEEALPLLRSGFSPEIIFLDIRMPGIDGITALPKILEITPFARVVMMTAYQTVESVVSSMKSGAVDFLVKPLNPQMIVQTIQKYSVSNSAALPIYEYAKQESKLKFSSTKKEAQNVFMAQSEQMMEVLSVADKFAKSDEAVLLLGESGTGKELLAQYVHSKSRRLGKPFVVVDCASIPETLFESELFGYEKGAFTGADSAKVGRFELADGGTLFLDEIGNVPLTLQAKLLRFIQDHKISRLGGKKVFELNIRLIAATNENLQELIEKGSFREDLYYRLTALTLHLLPLRNRSKEGKEFLAKFFLEQNAKRLSKKNFLLSEEVRRSIFEYPWPGNVREMENALYSACLLCDSVQLEMKHLPVGIQSYFENKNASAKESVESELSDQTLRQVLEKVEKERILSVVEQVDGNKKKAAEILDMDYKNLLVKLKKYAQDD